MPCVDRMQTVAGQDEAARDLSIALRKLKNQASGNGLATERVVTVLTDLLAEESRILDEERVIERSYR